MKDDIVEYYGTVVYSPQVLLLLGPFRRAFPEKKVRGYTAPTPVERKPIRHPAMLYQGFHPLKLTNRDPMYYIYIFIHSIMRLFIHSFIHLFIYTCILCLFIYACIHLFIYTHILCCLYCVYTHSNTPSFLLVQVFISLPSPWVPDTLPSCRPWARATWSPTSQPAPVPCCHCSPSILGGIQPPKKRIEKTQSYSKMLVNCGRSLSFLSKGVLQLQLFISLSDTQGLAQAYEFNQFSCCFGHVTQSDPPQLQVGVWTPYRYSKIWLLQSMVELQS